MVSHRCTDINFKDKFYSNNNLINIECFAFNKICEIFIYFKQKNHLCICGYIIFTCKSNFKNFCRVLIKNNLNYSLHSKFFPRHYFSCGSVLSVISSVNQSFVQIFPTRKLLKLFHSFKHIGHHGH